MFSDPSGYGMFGRGLLDKLRAGASKAKAYMAKQISGGFLSGFIGGVLGWAFGQFATAVVTAENPFASNDPRWLDISDVVNSGMDIFIAGMTGVAIESGYDKAVRNVRWNKISNPRRFKARLKALQTFWPVLNAEIVTWFKDYTITMYMPEDYKERVIEWLRDAGKLIAVSLTTAVVSGGLEYTGGIAMKYADSIGKGLKGTRAFFGLFLPTFFDALIAYGAQRFDQSDGYDY